jgi:dihydrofolate reductase
MGSETFLQVKDIEKAGLIAEKDRLRVIMTSTPKKFQKYAVPGQIEFTDESPKQIVSNLEKRGYKQMLFVGGGTLLSSFLKENLIDELWMTLEPKIFGTGHVLASGKKLNINLKLIATQKLNEQGTLLLKYSVIK